MTGKGTLGAPFGVSRVIVLFLAQRAAESGRVVSGSLRDICAMFGMDWRKSRATLETHLRRVLETWYEESEPACTCCEAHCFRGKQIDFIDRASYCSNSGRFEVTLHPRFVEEMKQSPRCSLAKVREFIRDQQFAALDLCFWYRWASHSGWTDVDPFGENGPYSLLSIASAGPKQRCDLRARHEIVVQYDRDTPFQIVGRGALRRIQQIAGAARSLSSNLGLIARAGLGALARLEQRQRAKLPKVKPRKSRRNGRESRNVVLQKLMVKREEARPAAASQPPQAASPEPRDLSTTRSSRPDRRLDRLTDSARPSAAIAAARTCEPVARLLSLDAAEVCQATAAIREELRALDAGGDASSRERQAGRKSRQAMRSSDRTENTRDQLPRQTQERGPP